MTVDDWVHEAVQAAGTRGATVREIQRWIDENRGEELAVDTIEAALQAHETAGRLQQMAPGRWTISAKTDKADAVRRLFGE